MMGMGEGTGTQIDRSENRVLGSEEKITRERGGSSGRTFIYVWMSWPPKHIFDSIFFTSQGDFERKPILHKHHWVCTMLRIESKDGEEKQNTNCMKTRENIYEEIDWKCTSIFMQRSNFLIAHPRDILIRLPMRTYQLYNCGTNRRLIPESWSSPWNILSMSLIVAISLVMMTEK